MPGLLSAKVLGFPHNKESKMKTITEPMIEEDSPQESLAPANSGVNIPVFDPGVMGQYMLELINDARSQAGLQQVAWDETIATIAIPHAQEMAEEEYISHWNQEGYGPDVRFNASGGVEWVRENIHTSWHRYSDGSPVPIEDWGVAVKDGHESLMDSPGHRENILEPGHTHVGIAFAYNETTGYFTIAQEFVNRYISILNEPPREVEGNQDILFQAKLLGEAENPVVNLFYETLPQAMTIDQLKQTSSYISPSTFVDSIPVQFDDENTFTFSVHINENPGIYHIMIWVENGGTKSQSIDFHIWVP